MNVIIKKELYLKKEIYFKFLYFFNLLNINKIEKYFVNNKIFIIKYIIIFIKMFKISEKCLKLKIFILNIFN